MKYAVRCACLKISRTMYNKKKPKTNKNKKKNNQLLIDGHNFISTFLSFSKHRSQEDKHGRKSNGNNFPTVNIYLAIAGRALAFAINAGIVFSARHAEHT